MTYTETTSLPHSEAVSGGFFASIVARYMEWRAYRDTCKELSRMTDMELADMGIGRGEIEFIARGGVKDA